jgi:hypothetical protein
MNTKEEDCTKLRETLGLLTSLDYQNHERLDNSEYEADLQKREENIESAEHTILRTSRQMERHLATSTAEITIIDALKGSNNGSSDFLHQPRYVYP